MGWWYLRIELAVIITTCNTLRHLYVGESTSRSVWQRSDGYESKFQSIRQIRRTEFQCQRTNERR